MEQAIMHGGRRTGWSDGESKLLWETADEAQQQGLPLKAVFEKIANQTGRRPNSIRNYYYAQVREQAGGQARTARFVPFTDEEVIDLMGTILRDRAKGRSVRSCLQRISGGDHSLMLRFQNKYRAVIKNRPDIVRQVVDKLSCEGVDVKPPEVNSRARTTLNDACASLVTGATKTGDAELVRAMEALSTWLQNHTAPKSGANVRMDLYRMALDERQNALVRLIDAGIELIEPIKEYLGTPAGGREAEAENFCANVAGRIGALEARIQEAESFR
jgi:hypothetical protein